jgi:hypothetical protein
MNAINYGKLFSRSHDAVIRVYDEADNVIETREQRGRFQGVLTVIFPSGVREFLGNVAGLDGIIPHISR